MQLFSLFRDTLHYVDTFYYLTKLKLLFIFTSNNFYLHENSGKKQSYDKVYVVTKLNDLAYIIVQTNLFDLYITYININTKYYQLNCNVLNYVRQHLVGMFDYIHLIFELDWPSWYFY